MSSIAKTNNAFNALKSFFGNLFGDDISGFDKYINKPNKSAEDMETARIAEILKKSLDDLSNLPEDIIPKKSTRLSVKSKPNSVDSGKSRKIQKIEKKEIDKGLSK